jgi:phospholipid N-methyltransferase
MSDTLRFLRAFAQRPFATGAIAPSSRHLAAEMLSGMRLRDAQTVVEIGPGTGAMTRAIVEAIGPGTLLLAVELNPDFAAHLQATLPARVKVVNGSGEHLDEYLRRCGREAADCVVCGLPWANFGRDLQQRLLDGVLRIAAGRLLLDLHLPARGLAALRPPFRAHASRELHERRALAARLAQPAAGVRVPLPQVAIP